MKKKLENYIASYIRRELETKYKGRSQLLFDNLVSISADCIAAFESTENCEINIKTL
ncbi:MAG: hypothetical protein WC389_08030 [Lutibacter sp.]|jgi:hypothetical protein